MSFGRRGGEIDSVKLPSVIRRHDAASAASGMVMAARVSSPNVMARPRRRRGEIHILRIEKLAQMVEFGFTAVGDPSVHDVGGVGSHGRDQRLSRAGPPVGGGPLDRVQIVEQVHALTDQPPHVLGRCVFGVLPVVVRRQELAIGGDRVTTHTGLLVAQRRLQLEGGDPRRLNLVAQVARHLVGAVQQHRAGHRTGEHQHTHAEQHEEQPAPDGERSSRL
jgi:hypothetical protein